MPLYEYQCTKCGKVFERLQRFSDAPLETHDDCGGHVERLISAPAFHLKGSGWYATDYAKTSSSKTDGKSTESKSESKDESKTDSKSESNSDSKSDSKPASETKSESKTEAPAAKSD